MPRKALGNSPLDALGEARKKAKAKGKPKRKARKVAAGAKIAAEGDKRPRTIYLPQDVDRRLRLAAAEQDKTVSDLIAEAVGAYLTRP